MESDSKMKALPLALAGIILCLIYGNRLIFIVSRDTSEIEKGSIIAELMEYALITSIAMIILGISLILYSVTENKK